MASQDNYFVVRKGLGVGTQALYADSLTKTVAIGKTVARYSLDVVGDIYSNDAIYAQNNVGVGTTTNFQQLDVIGSAYISQSVGIGTTNPTQSLQVGPAYSLNSSNVTVITGIGSVGVGTTTPRGYKVDIYGNTRIVGFATIDQSFTGIATIGFASITSEIVGISTIGFASITSEIVGISTIGFASITNEIVGISTIGIASITNEIVGISTIGIASVGFAVIGSEIVGISTIENLYVTGITTTVNLDVGIGGTILKGTIFPTEEVYNTDGVTLEKVIRPLVGIGSTSATRTLDVSGDVRIRGEVVDSQNNVGFAYSVLASSSNIAGRFTDAANLLVLNKDFIANEIVGFITSTDGPFSTNGPSFDYGVVGVSTGIRESKRNIGLIIDAIAFDISKGGNSKTVGIGLSYYAGIQTLYLDSNPVPSGFSAGYVKTAILAGISSISTLARFVINNSPVPGSYQSGIGSIRQLFDLEVLPDGDSNTNPDGCVNVVSAIHTCVGIVTTISNLGPGSAPKVNNPYGKLVWNPPGARIGNEWFVNKLGSDFNGGTGPGDAFLTIKKACSVAQPGDTIRVYAGIYTEDGPIQVPERVAVVGEDLRRTLVTTKDSTDLFHVRRGCYIAQMSFVGPSNPGKAMVSFPTRGYGYANGTEEDWQSPYIQNCTNFVPDSIGMRVDGDRAGGFKSMVLDAYTQYNQGGIGVSISNFGYSQLVSLFTICCDTAVTANSGGVTDLNNSNSSFGNFGLIADGSTPLQYTGNIISVPNTDNVDRLTLNVGVGASQAFKDSVTILRQNKDFIASEVVGFVTSTSGPLGAAATYFDYGGSVNGKDKCKRDAKLIVESICSDILTLGNLNAIYAGSAYRDSADGSITYLPETSPPPGTLPVGYVKDVKIAAIEYIAGISTYIVRNLSLPVSYQSGFGSFPQIKVSGMTTSSLIDPFINSRAGIITSILGIGTQAIPDQILPKGQRPYDGQIAVIDSQYYFISRIEINNPGYGYDPTLPVEVIIDLPPDQNKFFPGEPGVSDADFFIPAEAAIFETNVGAGGTITSIDILVSGTGYLESPPTVTISPPPLIGPGIGTTATATAVMEKYFFNPISATEVDASGNTTVVFDEFVTYPVSLGATVYFYQSSKIIASSITFEYVGTGINIVNAIPSKGAVPKDENQIVATNGGKVPFTSTDQSGDFRISEGITINQNTGTISGQAFSKSLQAEVTPLIIALQQ
jgi:hypothetical protein